MKILGIETSTEVGSVALVEAGRLVAQADIDTYLSHSSRLIPILNSILKKAGWGVGELEGVGVGLGPGSFTGIRVGLASAQGIAFGNSIPLVGIGSFAALVRGSSFSEGMVSPLLRSRRGQIYGARYRKKDDKMEELSPPEIIAPARLGELCHNAWIVSPQWEELQSRLEVVFGDAGIIGGEKIFPRARWVAILAERRLRENPAGEIKTATPIYLSNYLASGSKLTK
ncbi:MAG: tRNA (adenosine(37)-N6)-threonylcarbamoyltransferase complex dimerization subunit type 1 TsaB [Candidatus Euphemobacter frigidus]|nr:tRNA (adenosine(37)-N6)-threonylcarbamoyltransferase complex dimerization subunit type 1 TsaB [Candidatus Euphemobacter frigidus]MDP8275772.1 tRNA (adenosine(37)-N6)-threonylcarbamoyltransferase complex dimerization subunit type 1 TsaB [Candidatus Euphemobacter frigidus]